MQRFNQILEAFFTLTNVQEGAILHTGSEYTKRDCKARNRWVHQC